MKKNNRYDDGSWAVDYSAQDPSFTIEAIDYHAGPLKLTLDQLIKLTGGALIEKEAPQQAQEPVGINRREGSMFPAAIAPLPGLEVRKFFP